MEVDGVGVKLTEEVAKKIAVANNGGDWASHYTEEQKEVWREHAREIIRFIIEDRVEKLFGVID